MGEVVLDDLAAGRGPHAVVAEDVAESGVERADPVGHPHDERMHMGANIPGKPRIFMRDIGGVYRQTCGEVATKGHERFSRG